ncbi:MAG: ABC transporter permease [Oscillospiraceae bacterium]|nr:ABC transporter permease [Oscillospiraceae bacterium]
MGLSESIRLALEGLRANKMRSVLTMLGIIIGIGAVIGILTVGNGLTGSITGSMSGLGASNIGVTLQEKDDDTGGMASMMGMINPDDDDLITDEMLDTLRERYGEYIVGIAIGESAGSGQAKDGRLYANVGLSGVNEEYQAVQNIDLLGGRWIQQKDIDGQRNVCVVSDKLVNNMFSGNISTALNSEVKIERNGEMLSFRIVGVYEYEASAMGYSMASEKDISTAAYLPISTAKHITGAPDGHSGITIQASSDIDSQAMASVIEDFLNHFYRNNKDYSVIAIAMSSMVESLSSIMNTLSIAISIIAGISLLVGGIGVMNIMLVSVTERTREIGTRKALGATNNDIRVQFVVESIIVCLIGGFIGIVLGTLLGYMGSSLLSEPSYPTAGYIILAVGFSMAIGIFFGYYPANKAAKLDPIEALRYE